jgi:hypothetical protein
MLGEVVVDGLVPLVNLSEGLVRPAVDNFTSPQLKQIVKWSVKGNRRN